jgi:hypothetical protein
MSGGIARDHRHALADLPDAVAHDLHINVMDYGAVGDGLNDDTTAFNLAATDAAYDGSHSRTVVVPCGIYKITGTVTLGNGVRLVGCGKGGTKLVFTPSGNDDVCLHATNSGDNLNQFKWTTPPSFGLSTWRRS